MKKIAALSIQYSGFVVVLVGQNDFIYRREWVPGKGEYEKNLFCTYSYQGLYNEYRSDNDQLINSYQGEYFLNKNLVVDFPTYEKMEQESTWLCFSSYKPYEGTFIRLTDSLIIPPDVGVYCALGSFTTIENEKCITAKALNYLKPRERDVEIVGNAKLILIKLGNFVNTPAT